MLKKQKKSLTTLQNRREFLSRSTITGGMLILGASSSAPVFALTSSVNSGLDPVTGALGSSVKSVSIGNADVSDFTDLLGHSFTLRNESGVTANATLIEANASATPLGLRFRREQFSIVLDVPNGIPLEQGKYHISNSKIGSMDLFMVPVDLPTVHNRLEAVFS